jgi:CBS domain-containing protein
MTTVRELVRNKPVFTIDVRATVQDAVEFMALKNIGAVCVMDQSRMAGIFSERDVVNRVVARRLPPEGTAVSAVMTTKVVVAHVDETHESCVRKMQQTGCRHLPVVDGEQLIGVISLRDLLQVDILEKDDKIEFLHNYLIHVPSK